MPAPRCRRCSPTSPRRFLKPGISAAGERRRTAASLATQLTQSTESVMKNLFKRFVNEEAGQDLIEYALLAGLISLVCVLAITNAGTKVSQLFTNVTASIP